MEFITSTIIAVNKESQFGDGFYQRQIDQEVSGLVPDLSQFQWKRATHRSGVSLLYAELSDVEARKVAKQYGKRLPRIGYMIPLLDTEALTVNLVNRSGSFELNLHQKARLNSLASLTTPHEPTLQRWVDRIESLGGVVKRQENAISIQCGVIPRSVVEAMADKIRKAGFSVIVEE